jgi:Concanavalin A-like lectin/glucanases superfamily/VanZ like family
MSAWRTVRKVCSGVAVRTAATVRGYLSVSFLHSCSDDRQSGYLRINQTTLLAAGTPYATMCNAVTKRIVIPSVRRLLNLGKRMSGLMSISHDRSQERHDRARVRLLVPIIVLIMGTTAIPVELRRFDFTTLSLHCGPRDVMVNLLLYVPVGVVLARRGFWPTVFIATLLSLSAEICQFFMMHRYPSPIDLVLNVAGATIGFLIGRQWRIDAPAIRLNARTAWLAVLAVLAIIGLTAMSEWGKLFANCRGAILPGSLEAHWTFDELADGVLHDSSGNGLDGTRRGRATLADGIHGMAVRFDGEKDSIDFGHPAALRLLGSMTICAWINGTSFPIDDAAIVSTLSPGYQLDTTVDRGPRTIGFKLAEPCGKGMARYGATELRPNTWYHVAGVYDADARTLHVYLNGHLDDGFLRGAVAHAQKTSGQRVCVGTRADMRGFEFAGLIDDVHIYSRALEQVEIEKTMEGARIDSPAAGKAVYALPSNILAKRLNGHVDRCYRPTRSDDAIVPGLMVAVGMLSAVACAGFWPGHRPSLLGVSLAVGLMLVPAAAIILPPYVPWILPLLSLAGGASVAASLTRSGGHSAAG